MKAFYIAIKNNSSRGTHSTQTLLYLIGNFRISHGCWIFCERTGEVTSLYLTHIINRCWIRKAPGWFAGTGYDFCGMLGGRMAKTGGVAIFDFDRTLVRQGSLAIFLSILVGRGHFLAACTAAAVKAVRLPPPQRRERFRSELLRRTLAGKNLAMVRAAAQETYARLDWKPDILAACERHRAAGHRILVATGGLTCYMPTLLAGKGLRTDGLLASDMITHADVLTGEMAGPSCTWEEKARRVSKWLDGTSEETWGYGNLPNDAAMLALVRHPHVVSK
jgi:phosphatidylglycerophosphatase C